MPRKKLPAVDYPMPTGFDHVASSHVDVVRHEEFDFIQVWNADHSRVIFSYRRTLVGPKDVEETEEPATGPCKTVSRDFRDGYEHRVYQYRGPGRRTRYERTLPSGRLLVEDDEGDEKIKDAFTDGFDWAKRKPVGRHLKDRGIHSRQRSGATWYLTYYQVDASTPQGRLVCVEEHVGHDRVRLVEFD